MEELKKINILSFVKLQTLMGALIGLGFGILYSIGGLFVDIFVSLGWLSAEAMETPGLSYGTVLAMGALFIMPLIGAGFGLVLGIFEALFYNLFARWFGGIKGEFKSQ